jgi:type IV pilus assembly protein PilB
MRLEVHPNEDCTGSGEIPIGSSVAAARIPVGELLVEAGVVDRGALEVALQAQRETGMPLGRVIVSQGLASAETVANVLAAQYGRTIRAEFGVREETMLSAEALARRSAANAQGLAELRTKYAQLEAELEERRRRIAQLEARIEQHSRPTQPTPVLAISRAAAAAAQSLFSGPRLGELLIEKGFISGEQLDDALHESKATCTMLGRVLLEKGYVFEDELARCLSERWELEFVSLARVGVDPFAVSLMPRQIGLEFATIPVRFSDNAITVAFADPSDEGAVAAVERFVWPFTPAVAVLSDITMMWQRRANSPDRRA